MSQNIYISSLAFNNKSPDQIVEISKENNWPIEFTSNLKFSKNLKSFYKNMQIKRSPHNYFPPAKKPFVLNLASKNNIILKKSINHCINGLKLAKFSNSPFFAAHAGFCIDPHFSELGKKIDIKEDFDREFNKNIFIKSISEILKIANNLNIKFLIENNVIPTWNMKNGKNPLLCCDSSEIIWLVNSINSSKFGILLDTAHLKVSCKTLNKNIEDEFKKIRPFVKAIHHSDNDGKTDNNMPITKNYWFLKYLKYFKNIVHVIEVKNLNNLEIIQQINIIKKEWN